MKNLLLAWFLYFMLNILLKYYKSFLFTKTRA